MVDLPTASDSVLAEVVRLGSVEALEVDHRNLGLDLSHLDIPAVALLGNWAAVVVGIGSSVGLGSIPVAGHRRDHRDGGDDDDATYCRAV